MEPWEIAMFIYVGILFLGVPLVVLINVKIQKKKKKRENPVEDDEAELEPGAQVEEPISHAVQAKAVAKRIHTEFYGVKMVKSVQHFLITFETERGTRREFEVSREYFEKISENDEGTLVTLNGNFFDFGEGEDIETTE